MSADLAPGGVAVFDIPDLMARLQGNRFDLLGHAVPALPSLLVAEMLLWQHGLVPLELETVPGPGPWLRLLVRHEEDATKPIAGTVLARREAEREMLNSKVPKPTIAPPWQWWRPRLRSARPVGRRPPAGGRRVRRGEGRATLAAATGLGPGLLGFTVHPEVGQSGLELPGSQLPILPPTALDKARPDLLLVLDGTPAPAVRAALARHCRWEGRLALPLPGLSIT